MLKVSVDLKQGVYIISEDDGKRIVTKPMAGSYDREKKKERIVALKSYPTFTPEEKSDLLDFGLYDALQEFDQKYSTTYAKRYFDTTTKQIPLTGLSEKKRDYEKRATRIKTQEFANAGISVQYNLSLFGGAKELTFGERIRAIRQAFKQKQNGVRVEFSDGKKQLLDAPIASEPVIGEDDIPDMPDAKTLEEMKKEDEKSNVQEAKVEPVIPVPQPNVEPTPEVQIEPETIATLANPNQQNIDEMIKKLRSQGIGNQVVDIKPKDEPEEPDLASAFEGRRVASEGRPPQTPKKKISRSKSKQASKNAQREAAKLKNSYQSRIDAKAKRKEEAEKRRAEGPKPKKEAQQPTPQPPKQQPAPQQPAKKTIAYSPKGAKAQEGSLVTRFTRKIKDKADSIRNKKFFPSLNPKQKKIAKAATLVALVGALGIGMGYRALSNSNANRIDVENPTNTPQIVETVKPEQKVDKDGIDYILGIHDTATKIPNETQTPSIEDTKPSAPIIEETGDKEQESREAYLSSIKVGTAMNITSGKYFETPEGQGNYGHFENFTEGRKIIQFIDVMTDEGYIVIKDDSVNLFELKQQYPNAKFSYHMVYENADGTTRPLGWLTEDSMDQNLQQDMSGQQSRVDIDDFDR